MSPSPSPEPQWQPPWPGLALSGGQVHLWRAPLDVSPEHLSQMEQFLSAEERARAGRFHFAQDRGRFVAGRGVLRTLLGRYLGLEPACVRFSLGPYGKPYLAEGMGDGGMCFNLAHSGEIALYAFCLHRQVGVDVEQLRFIDDAEQVASQFFSAHERTVWDSVPMEQKQEAFYNCWTRKEAYIKATGRGLSERLDLIDVSLVPGAPAELLSVGASREEALRWSLTSLSPGEGYVAALAVEGQGWRLRCWQYA